MGFAPGDLFDDGLDVVETPQPTSSAITALQGVMVILAIFVATTVVLSAMLFLALAVGSLLLVALVALLMQVQGAVCTGLVYRIAVQSQKAAVEQPLAQR